ncbi:MAG: hypothetical protein HY558_07835 [Euryarchaeota archaeon]|nr:hypothetical protein [Euryarchaeota archaeon]
MPTTIQIDKTTLQLLQKEKKQTRARSYNQVIRDLLGRKSRIADSMFGAHPHMAPFTREDRMRFHDED